MKTCTKCKIEKPFEEFGKRSKSKDGLKYHCKQCCKKYRLKNKDKLKEYGKEYRLKNKEYYKEYSKEYQSKNKDRRNKYNREYRLKNKEYNREYRLKNKEYFKEYYIKNKERILEKSKEYRLNNKEYYKEYRLKNKEYYKEYRKEYELNNRDKLNKQKREYNKKISHIKSWRDLLHNSLKRLGNPKQGKTIDLLGYSAIDLKHHLESLFIEGMTWENRSEWHIDHIIPVSAFKKDTPPHIVNKLENLRPVWAVENLSKKDKYNEQEVPKEMFEYIEI